MHSVIFHISSSKHRVVLATSTLLAVTHYRNIVLGIIHVYLCVHHGLVVTRDDASVLIAKCILELKIAKVTRRTVGTWAWGSKTRVSTPLSFFLSRADILCYCGVEI